MSEASKTHTSLPAASWRRELLHPAVALLGISVLLSWVFRLWPVLIPLLIATIWLSVRYPDALIPGRFLKRSSEPHSQTRRPVDPLQRASNGADPDIEYGQIEHNVRLPEIETAPKWVQYLIAYAGAPIFNNNSIGKNSAFYDGMLEAIPFMVGVVLALITKVLVQSDTAFGPLSKWCWLLIPPIGMLIVSYRLSFRRLHDIYTKDAANTGRHAFPALRR